MSLSKELAAYINRYCDSKGNSLTSLSRESGVPYGSVKRIAQGESVPEFYNTLKILMVVRNEPEECFDFIKRHYDDVGDFLAKVNYDPARKGLVDALQDKVSFYIINLAAASGTSRSYILEEYGRNGLATLDSLLERGLLKEVNQRIVAEGFSSPNIDSVLGQVKFLLEDFDVGNLGNHQSLASLQVFAVNARGAQKIHSALREFIQKVFEIKDQKDLSGDQVMFLATLYNSLRGGQ